MPASSYSGPATLAPEGLSSLAPGIWLTRGRAALVESDNGLTMIDPGDEPLAGILEDLSSVENVTGKALSSVALTHAHPDHVANLPALLAHRPGVKVVAHIDSPVEADQRVVRKGYLPDCPELLALPLRGHSPWGDDLAFYHGPTRLLFSGDIVQPKGDSWERAFYPSPYPFFTDGDTYVSSLEELLALDFDILLTGHRELRRSDAAREWVELTRRAILEVELRVERIDPSEAEFAKCAMEIYVALCKARGIDDETVAKRMSPPEGSAFQRYDLPGIVFYWLKRFDVARG